ncbi:MAG: hydroxyquinol 1,2-dioxygenase [Thermoplasmata archaeon]
MVTTGSMQEYEMGNLLLINDRPIRYAMSNIFDIGATWGKAYERVAVAKNGPYVIACFRAEGEDPSWWYVPHDEYALLVEGEVRVDYVEPREELEPGPHAEVSGTDMGHILMRDGSLASLPARVAYRMRATRKSLVLLQTKDDPWITYDWETICLTED